MAEPTSNLRCSKCGAAPAPGLPAKAGGTHYATKTREKEARKTEGRFTRATSCGTWTEVADG
jgi:hypothetical protein